MIWSPLVFIFNWISLLYFSWCGLICFSFKYFCMHSICCMDLLLENCYTRSFMRMPKRIHGACTFSSYVHLEVSFTSHGALTATCFSSPETAEFRNKGLISSRLTENGTGTCSSDRIQSTFFLVSYMGFPVPWLWYFFHFSNFPFFTGTTSYFFKLSLLQWPSTSFHSLLIYLYGIQEVLLLLWYSTLGFQSLSTIGYTDASMETIFLPATIHCTMRLQSHSPLQVKGIKTHLPI